MLNVSWMPKRLVLHAHAEPVGSGAMGVRSAFLPSGRSASPFNTSQMMPSPDAVAITLGVRTAPHTHHILVFQLHGLCNLLGVVAVLRF